MAQFKPVLDQRKANGQCIDCSKPAIDLLTGKSHVRCRGCRDKLAIARRLKLLRGLCGVCGQQPRRPGRTTCHGCAVKASVNHKNYLAKHAKTTCNATQAMVVSAAGVGNGN